MRFIMSDLNDSDEYYDYEHLESIEKLLEDEDCACNIIINNDVWKGPKECQNKREKKIDKYDCFDKFENKKRSPSRNKKYGLINRRIDTGRIRHKVANNLEVHTNVCKNIKLNENDPVRSGAIIYIHYKGKTYFCMGVEDRKSVV